MKSPATYAKLKAVCNSPHKDLVVLLDAGKIKISKAHKELVRRGIEQQVRDDPLPKRLGPNRVKAGDSLALMRKMPPASFDAVFSDPPFGIGRRDGDWTEPDNPADYWRWFSPFVQEMNRVLKPGGFLGLFQSYKYLRHFWDWFGDDFIIFASCQIGELSGAWRFTCWYPVVIQFKPGAPPLAAPGNKINHWRTNIGDKSKYVLGGNVHECPRTIDECERIIKSYIIAGAKILDPFAGVGTIGVATQRAGEDRVYYGIERRPDMAKKANRRLPRMTPGDGTPSSARQKQPRLDDQSGVWLSWGISSHGAGSRHEHQS